MPAKGLTPKRVRTAIPKRDHYVIRDRKVKGLGLLVAPSGRKTYTLEKVISGTRHKETIGEESSLTLKEARAVAGNRIEELAALHNAGPDTPFEAMVDLTLKRMARLWKPSTLQNKHSYIRNHLIPHFKGRGIASITRRDVEEWHVSLRSKPGAARVAASLLSVIMHVAEETGARPDNSNPVRAIKYYQQGKWERALSPDEMARLGAVLAAWEDSHPLHTSLIRLLALTGCRVGELQNLHWRDYRNGHLFLPDSKTGPRTIFLCTPARSIMDRLDTPRRGLVFPPRSSRSKRMIVDDIWQKIRHEAGLDDVRLHDLRHNFASQAIRSGESLTVIGVQLGHSDPRATMKYTHLDDGTMRDAVETVGKSMIQRNGGNQ